MARLLVVHDDREDVQVEISQTDRHNEYQGQCTCGDYFAHMRPNVALALRDTIEAACEHVDQTHRSL